MTLKENVEALVKEQKRSLSWLASEIGMSVDGLRLSLIRQSIKYGDIVTLCRVLGISPTVLFGAAGSSHIEIAPSADVSQKDDKELIAQLKARLKDKDRIIELMSK